MAFGRVAGATIGRTVLGPHDVGTDLISTRRTHHILSQVMNCRVDPLL